MEKYKLAFLFMLILFLSSGCTNGKIKDNIDEVNKEYLIDFSSDIKDLEKYRNEVVRERFKNKVVKISAVGDIMLGRGVGSRLKKSGKELAYKNLESIFNRADILFGNLEHPISDRGKKLPGKGICLRAQPEMVEILEEAGFDILSLANNHILDYDSEALIDTLNILKSKNIGYVGAGENINEARTPYIIRVKNRRIGFLAYDEFAHYYYSTSYKRRFVATNDLPGTAPKDINIILEDIKKVRESVDFLIVSLHWGVEESNFISQEQRAFAKRLIDNGVDIILGHHPHVIQPIEIYKGKPIIYSMGNYIFDQNDENNKQGMVVSIIIQDRDIERLEVIPIYIQNKSEPIIAKGSLGMSIMNKLIKLSQGVGASGKIHEGMVIFDIQ